MVLALAGTASAKTPPETFTQASTDSDHFTGVLPCKHESYDVTVTGHSVFHYTYFPDTDTLHVHSSDHASIVAVPVDGTGPTLRGNFSDLDSDNVRAVRHGAVLVEKDTDIMRAISRGSDGSGAFIWTHTQLTINANGKTTVQFQIDKIVCS